VRGTGAERRIYGITKKRGAGRFTEDRGDLPSLSKKRGQIYFF